MDKIITLKLPSNYVGQMLDGLRCREQAYRMTAEYLEEGSVEDPYFVCEDVADAEEARNLAELYQKIITSVEEQMR